MPTFTLATVDDATGRLIIEDHGLAEIARADLADLGQAQGFGCARPIERLTPKPQPDAPGTRVRLADLEHDSLIVGPGRRSVARLQGCPIRCVGCWVPETWDMQGGYSIDVESLADALLDASHARDGVTILGGEPFAQPEGLAALVAALRARQPGLNILVYSGYTLQALERRAANDPHLAFTLRTIDTLIDGPYVAAQADSAGLWTGSGNQRVITY